MNEVKVGIYDKNIAKYGDVYESAIRTGGDSMYALIVKSLNAWHCELPTLENVKAIEEDAEEGWEIDDGNLGRFLFNVFNKERKASWLNNDELLARIEALESALMEVNPGIKLGDI